MAETGPGFLQASAKQIRDTWNALSLPQRVTFSMFLLGSVVLVVLVGLWSNQPSYVPLVADLTAQEVAAASSKLRDAQIPVKFDAGRGMISVPSGMVDEAHSVIAGLGLVSSRSSGDGFELFDNQPFGMTDFAQKVQYLRALQGSLERKIAALDGVDSAHVTLTLPRDELFVRDRQPPKASVEVKPRRGHQIGNSQVTAIRHIISSAVPRLVPRNVAVMDSEGRMLARFEDPADVGALAGNRLEARMRTEAYLRNKVETLLDQAIGAGRSAVQVAAEMSFQSVERHTRRMDPDSGVVLKETIQSNDSQGPSSGASGAAGVASNNPSGGKSIGSLGRTSKEKTVSNSYHYDTVTETVKPDVGRLERLAVAVLVKPKVVKEEGGGQKFVPLSDVELTRLTDAVKHAIGYTQQRGDEVKVENAPEPDPVTLALLPPVPQPTGPSFLRELKHHLPNLASAVGILVLAFVLWRSMRKLTAPLEAPAETPAEDQMSTGPRQTPPSNGKPQNRIQGLVGQNPAQATEIIRALLHK